MLRFDFHHLRKVTPKAGHQSWQAVVLWPFYICFAAAWGVWDLGLLESHSAHDKTLADFLICYCFSLTKGEASG